MARLGALAAATGTMVYAWALLPNHAHLLLRSGAQGLPQCMRRWLTGYALGYHRRHQRVGHLFQNRYTSIVVEEEPYFCELVGGGLLRSRGGWAAVRAIRADTARQLGVSTSGIAKALARAERARDH